MGLCNGIPNEIYTGRRISWYTILITKSREVNESLTSKETNIANEDAFHNEVLNSSSSNVERVIIHDPTIFFIDLTMFESNHLDDYEEEQIASDNEDQNEDMDDDDQIDDDDLV